MEEQLISLETAKLAKEKGFKIPTKVMYKGNEKSYGHNNEWGIDEKRLDGEFPYTNQQWYSIPTQSVLQKWLREKHNIHIVIMSCVIPSNEVKFYIFRGKLKWNWGDLFNTYEEALEVGLQEALKLVKF